MDEKTEVALRGEEFKRFFENSYSEIKHKYNLRTVDIELMIYFSHCKDENTPTDIFRRIRINKGHISQGIDNLIKEGYLNSQTDSTDRRVVHYSLNKNADKVLREIISVRRALENKIFKGFTPDEIAKFKEFAIKILNNIEEKL